MKLEELNSNTKKNVDICEMDMYELMDVTIEVGRLVFNLRNCGDDIEEQRKKAYLKKVIKVYEKIVNKCFREEVLDFNKSLIMDSSKFYQLFFCINKKIYNGGYQDKSSIIGINKKELLCKLAQVGYFVEKNSTKCEKINQFLNEEKQFLTIKILYYAYINEGLNYIEEEAVAISQVFDNIKNYYTKKEDPNNLMFFQMSVNDK